LLSELLCKYHKQKVYILIDEYDAPCNFMLENQYAETERENVALLITAILSACGKDNSKNVEKLILTGILDALHKEACSGLNNLNKYGITCH
jgi:hypothetical protein